MSRRQASTIPTQFLVALAAILPCALAPAEACDEAVQVTRLRPDAESYSYTSGLDEAGQILIRDAEDWATVWLRIHNRVKPVPPLPEIDFGRELIVVAALGRRRSGGHSIRIDRASREGGTTVIVVRRSEPATGCIATTAITSPVDIARLPSVPGPVEFRIESVVRSCN